MRVNAYRSRTGDAREKEEPVEVRRVDAVRLPYVHMYSCPCVLRTQDEDVLEVGAPTRGRERDGGGAEGREG